METSFENLIEPHRDALQRTALKLCHGDHALAQDMVQETFFKALRSADRFQTGTNLRAWLMRILYNNVMTVYRRRRIAREAPYPEGFDPVSEFPAPAEVSDEVNQALNELPEDYRLVFLMSAVDESPHREIAETLGIPVGTVMSRLWRARRELRRRLSEAVLN